MQTATKTETRELIVGEKKTHLTVGGQGPALLYLHGEVGDCCWSPCHDLLAEHYTVHLPAHPGFELSEGLDKIEDMGDYVWHYVDLCRQLDLQELPVIGFSLGGWVAAELAILRPELVHQLTLVSAAGLYVKGASVAEFFVDDLDTLRQRLFRDANSEVAHRVVPASVEDGWSLLRAREATARVGWNPYLHNPKLHQHLHRVSCPTQVLWGRNDQLIPLAHGQHYEQLIPRASLTTVDQCGHMLPLEQPAFLTRAAVQFFSSSVA